MEPIRVVVDRKGEGECPLSRGLAYRRSVHLPGSNGSICGMMGENPRYLLALEFGEASFAVNVVA